MRSLLTILPIVLLFSLQASFISAFHLNDLTGSLSNESTTRRVAVIQLNSSYVGNFIQMTKLAAEAKEQGAELVIFPESSVFGWLNPAVFTQSQPIPGLTSKTFQGMAVSLGIWICVGLAERGPQLQPNPAVYGAYDSSILINPSGDIVLHHRKLNVLNNAFNCDDCPQPIPQLGCNYTQGNLSDVVTADTPFGRTAIIVCADAYTYNLTLLSKLKEEKPDFVIVNWGIAAGSASDCGGNGFNATEFAQQAADYLGTATVIGANGVGPRIYGRFLPSLYCGTSGFAFKNGTIGGQLDTKQSIGIFDISV